MEEDIFESGGGETPTEDTKNSERCPIPEIIPGQVVWGSAQLALDADVPTDCSRVGLEDL